MCKALPHADPPAEVRVEPVRVVNLHLLSPFCFHAERQLLIQWFLSACVFCMALVKNCACMCLLCVIIHRCGVNVPVGYETNDYIACMFVISLARFIGIPKSKVWIIM